MSFWRFVKNYPALAQHAQTDYHYEIPNSCFGLIEFNTNRRLGLTLKRREIRASLAKFVTAFGYPNQTGAKRELT